MVKKSCLGCAWNPPKVWKINQEVWYLWGEIQTQWIVSIGGLVGLNYDSVENEARRNGIELGRSQWRKIKALERCVLDSQGEK